MGLFWDQLCLLLRIKLILRSREPVILALEILWPITVFLIIFGLKKSNPPDARDICHYNARVLPSGGALPMIQSLICNMENACLNRTQYEEFPSYSTARIQQIIGQLGSMLTDEDALDVIKDLPKIVRLVAGLATAVNDPEIKTLLDSGPIIVWMNLEKIETFLKDVLELDSPEVPKALVNARIPIMKLVNTFSKNSNDHQKVRSLASCDPSTIGKLPSISNAELQKKTSQALCSLMASKTELDIFKKEYQQHVDFTKLFKLMDELITSLESPDLARTTKDSVRTIQVGRYVGKGLPAAGKLRNRSKELESSHIDLKSLIRMTRDVEPLFGKRSFADAIRNALNYMDDDFKANLDDNIKNQMVVSKSGVIQHVKPLTLGSIVPYEFLFNYIIRNGLWQVSLNELLNVPIKEDFYKVFPADVGVTPTTFQYLVCKKYELSDLLHLPVDDQRLCQNIQDFKDLICSIKPQEHIGVKTANKPFEVKPVLELFTNRTELLSSIDKENNGLTKAIPVVRVIIEVMLNSLKESKMDNWKLIPHFVKIVFSILGNIFPFPYSNFGYAIFDGLEIILDLLGQGVSAINRENLVDHWPKFARTMVATFSNNETALPKKCSAFSKVFCDRSRFHTVVTIPDGDASPDIIRDIGCRLFKSIEMKESTSNLTLPEPSITAFSDVKNDKLNWGGAAKKIYSLLNKLQQMKAKVPKEISGKILEEVLDLWNNTSITNKMLAVLRTIDVMTDCIHKQNNPYWNGFLAILRVTGKVTGVLIARMRSIIDSNSAEVSSLSPESPVLSVAVEKIVSLTPDLIHTISNVLTKELKSVLKKFKDTDRLSKIPCHGVSISEILHFDKAKDVQELERDFCENTQQLLHEILMIPNIDSAARDIDHANKGKMVRMNWISQINNLEVFRDRTVKLSRFNLSNSGGIPGFDREFQESLSRIRHVVENISSSEKGIAKFVGYLLDSALMVFAEVNVTEDQRQLPFSLQCDFEVSQDENGKPDYASCIISEFRYAVWAATEVLEKINRYLSWITGTVGDPGRGEMPLIADIGLMLEEGISLLNSLIETALRHENMNLTLSQFCSGPAFLEVLVFPNEKAKLHVTHLQESLCIFMSTKENTVPFDGPFLQHLSVVKLLKNLNNTWYNSTPAEISSDISTFMDEAFDFYNNVVSIDKDPEGSLDKWNKAVLSSVWNEVNLKMNEILEKLMEKSFMYSLQALTPTLMEVIKNNSVLGERLGTSTLILEVADSYLKNDTHMEETAVGSEGLFEAVRPLMTWMQKHGIRFSGHMLYTLIMDGNKSFRLLYEEEPLNKLCSSPMSQFIHYLPGSNESSFEEAKDGLCKIDWKSMITFAKMKMERLNLTSYEVAKKFTSSLGTMLGTLYLKTTNPDSVNIEFLQTWNRTLHILKTSIDERNFTWDQSQNWLMPAIAAAASIIDKNGLTLLAIAEVVNSINCRLSMLKGGFSWDKVETAFANKPYVLSLLKILNSSIDVVNMTVDLLVQPDKFQVIRDAFLESNSSNNFCNNREWENHLELSNSNSLEIIRSIQYLICKGNANITLLNQLNPERLCVWKKSRELYAMGNFSPVVFATHVEELYQAINDLITGAYQGHVNSSHAFKEILNSQKWQKLFEELWYKLHEQLTPNGISRVLKTAKSAFGQSLIVDNIHDIVHGLTGLNILNRFKRSDFKYKLKDFCKDASSVTQLLMERYSFTNDSVDSLLKLSIDLAQILENDGGNFSLKKTFCDSKKLNELLSVYPPLNSENISLVLCNMSSYFLDFNIPSPAQQDVVFEDMEGTNPQDYGLPQLMRRVRKLGVLLQDIPSLITKMINKGPALIQNMQDLVYNITTMLDNEELNKINLSLGLSGSLQELIGKVTCGKRVVFFEPSVAKYIKATVKLNSSRDKNEVQKFPHPVCADAYEWIMKLPGGPVIWSYLKRFLKGKILYSPNNEVTRSIIKEVNKTFEIMDNLFNTLHKWEEGIESLMSLQEHEDAIHVLLKYVNSDQYKPLIETLLGKGQRIDEITQQIKNALDHIKKFGDLLNITKIASMLTKCVEINRFIGFDAETELEDTAKKLNPNFEFLVAIVFENLNDNQRRQRSKRSSSSQFPVPPHISYKIRLDRDNVPGTNKLKSRIWKPDPHNKFFQHLHYFHGFVYVQELMDRAITHVQLGHDLPLTPTVYLQQFPYPCHQKDSFGELFRRIMTVIIAIAWIFLIGFTIQDLVLQRELHLEEMLIVMGLRPVVSWLAWFIISYSILAINVIAFIPILKLGHISPQSDALLLLVFLFIYGLSNVMFCYLISSLFGSAAIASLIGIFVFLSSFLPQMIIRNLELLLSLFGKLASCLPMSSALAYGFLHIFRYEAQGVGLQWDNMWRSPVADDTMCFGYVLIMLTVDSVIYFLAGWYIGSVWPAGHKAMKQPWNFFMLPSYWGLKKPKHSYFYPEKTENLPRRHSSLAESGKSVGVSFLNLHIVYNPRSTIHKTEAVAGLTLDLLEGEITTLLGKNGAGKTTTINVLIGQFPPTSGAVYVYGKAVTTDYEETRKLLGYCPQYNILFKFLTVREHLIFCAKLKALIKDATELIKDVENILHSMGLWELRNEKIAYLSGGLQRRVCVALAFVGGSRLIVLDEPTSSIDPVARRSIWDLILRQKSGRTVLLTTHHMDEADILSDKVAIIHNGRVLCQGSPLLLKNKYSFGYKLTVARHDPGTGDRDPAASSKNEPCNGQGLLEFVKKIIPAAKLIEDCGSEVVIGIPSHDSSGKQQAFAEFFQALDANLQNLGYGSYGLSSSTLEDVFFIVCNPKDDVTHQESPTLQHLTQKRPSSDFSIADMIPSTTQIPFNASELDLRGSKTLTGLNLKMQQLSALLKKRFHHTVHNWRMLLCSIVMPCFFIALSMGLAKIREPQVPDPALELKPKLYGPHSASFFKLIEPYNETVTTPVFENLFGIKCSRNNTDLSMQCNARPARASDLLKYGHFSCKTLCRCQGPERKCMSLNHSSLSPPALLTDFGVTYNLSGIDVPEYILDTYCSFIESRYGGWTFHNISSGDAIKVWYENSGYHAMPSYLSALNNAILKANLRAVGTEPTEYGITTYNHPLNLRVEQVLRKESLYHRIIDISVGFTFLMGFAFIPASFVLYIVRERMNEEKRLQQVVGVDILLYWLSTLLWDLLILIVAVGFAAGVIAISQLPVYVARLNMPAVLIVSFFFGWAMMTVVYLMEGLFKEGTIAFLVIYCTSLFIGINFVVFTILLEMFPPSQKVVNFVEDAKTYAVVLPPYNLLNSLVELARNYMVAEIYIIFGFDVYENPFSKDMLGFYLITMGCQGILLFVLKVIIEQPINWSRWFFHFIFGVKHIIEQLINLSRRCFCSFGVKNIIQPPSNWIKRWFHIIGEIPIIQQSINWARSCFHLKKRRKPYTHDEDIDVANERKRVLNITSQNDIALQLMNVTKIFRGMMGKRTAVDNVSLAIPKGECFGLLGVNGAGKTTLFRILTGQIRPTLGKAYLNSQTISKMLAKSGQSLGYCPQADALDDLLTPVQHLTIYAKLRGIPSKEVPKVVEAAIIKFSLEMYAKQPVGTLSRGNKRKLCTAIAMLGDPEIILLDEPTSGMDPVTRRVVWHNVMQAIKANRSVVLTSHSMEECDILCSRLAIMVNGRFCCLGSPQYLKHRFGRGYTVSLQIDNADKRLQTISKFMSANFPSAHLRAHHYNMLEFNVPTKNITLSVIFDLLENERESLGILNFSVSQTTLDQVFVTFAQQQTDVADFKKDLVGLALPDISAKLDENPSTNAVHPTPTLSSSPLPLSSQTESQHMPESSRKETRNAAISVPAPSRSATDQTKVDISDDEQGHS